MTKPALIFILLFSLCASLQAQLPEFSKKAKEKKANAHFLELGVSGNWMLRQIIPVRNDSGFSQSSPYMVTARWGRKSWAVRFGLGGVYSRREIQLEGFGDKEIFYKNRYDLRLGFEKRYRLGEKLVGSLGLDATAFYQNDEQSVDSGFDVVTTAERSKGLGIGPVIGLSYFITPRLALFAEGSVIGQIASAESARLFQNFPQFDDEIEEVTSNNINIHLPATIYIAFIF
ncbi:MAG: hypothetical protein AB8F95_19805 [Bacteroidia bacterium]